MTTITESYAHQQIRASLRRHEQDLAASVPNTPVHHYAEMMIARCKRALAIVDPVSAWKHYIGR